MDPDPLAGEAEAIVSEVVASGHSWRRTPDRHTREALRAEIRRLARMWDVHVRTRVFVDQDEPPEAEPLLLLVVRLDAQPWDDQLYGARLDALGFGSAAKEHGRLDRPGDPGSGRR